ncbi:GNAT family N-acetyltransferase [Luteolibacter luteus]|uniref:GNAT family N-acetyltransferase n=1 Tax=Luteolibacter luteus TaxID=2728835 RepID=A0A858RED4_9BACT|nr:GNAT family N-acetyltransferase [Luteolibacter luteus]QJE95085.1 GNAT family N-acetyltransferase [Luteolibacter luteus]
MAIEIRRIAGQEITRYLTDAARLRISVFREYPYLYEGDEAAEQEYLASYAACPRSVFVLALDGDRVVGVSTGLPMVDADESFQAPFAGNGESPENWFYFGESVLDPAYRGQGIGHRFFDERERHAHGLGFRCTCFCSVIRPADHPLMPPGYRSHDVFWTKRGYAKQANYKACFSWKQVDTSGETENELVFWTRET